MTCVVFFLMMIMISFIVRYGTVHVIISLVHYDVSTFFCSISPPSSSLFLQILYTYWHILYLLFSLPFSSLPSAKNPLTFNPFCLSATTKPSLDRFSDVRRLVSARPAQLTDFSIITCQWYSRKNQSENLFKSSLDKSSLHECQTEKASASSMILEKTRFEVSSSKSSPYRFSARLAHHSIIAVPPPWIYSI